MDEILVVQSCGLHQRHVNSLKKKTAFENEHAPISAQCKQYETSGHRKHLKKVSIIGQRTALRIIPNNETFSFSTDHSAMKVAVSRLTPKSTRRRHVLHDKVKQYHLAEHGDEKVEVR